MEIPEVGNKEGMSTKKKDTMPLSDIRGDDEVDRQ